MVDSLFLALSLSSEAWEDGLSIGLISLIDFLGVGAAHGTPVLCAAEAGAAMVTGRATEMVDRDAIELANRTPSLQ